MTSDINQNPNQNPFALPDLQGVMPAGQAMTSDGPVAEQPRYPLSIGEATPVTKIAETVPAGNAGSLPGDILGDDSESLTPEEQRKARMGALGLDAAYEGVEVD